MPKKKDGNGKKGCSKDRKHPKSADDWEREVGKPKPPRTCAIKSLIVESFRAIQNDDGD